MTSRTPVRILGVGLLVVMASMFTGCGGDDVEPVGFDTVDEAYDAAAIAVQSRKLEAYRSLIAKDEVYAERFDEAVDDFAEVMGDRLAGKMALELHDDNYRWSTAERGKRYPAIVDGDRAMIVTSYIDTTRKNEIQQGTVSFKRIDGKWYLFDLSDTNDMEWMMATLDPIHEKFPPAEDPMAANPKPIGFDTVDAVFDAASAAVLGRDIGMYRRLIAKDKSYATQFDERITDLVKKGNNPSVSARALESQEFNYRWKGAKRGKRYPAIVDGDRALIVTSYISAIRDNEPSHGIVSFKQIEGKWYLFNLHEQSDRDWMISTLRSIRTKFPPAGTVIVARPVPTPTPAPSPQPKEVAKKQPVNPPTKTVVPPASKVPRTFAQIGADPLWIQPVSIQKTGAGDVTELSFAGNTKVTDGLIPLLLEIETLTSLDLSETSISDAGLMVLSAHEGIEHLRLSGTSVTDEGIKGLFKMDKLSSLDASNTAMGDRSLTILGTSFTLKQIDVRGTKVTKDRLAFFRRANKDVKVTADASLTAATPTVEPAGAETVERRTWSKAEFAMRRAMSGVRTYAIKNRKRFPTSLNAAQSNFFKAEDQKDVWGDTYLYFGRGKQYDAFAKDKWLILATAKARDGKRVVAWSDGDVETLTEKAFRAAKR